MCKNIFLFLVIIIMFPAITQGQAPISTRNAARDSINEKRNRVTGILGAFPPEIFLLKEKMLEKKEKVIRRILFTEGILNGRKVVLAQTGIGKVNAAITTTLMLEHFEPEQLIFTGIAGGINPSLSPGDLVIGTLLAYHDYGTITPDSMMLRPTRDVSTMQENPIYFPCSPELIQLAELAAKTFLPETISGTDSAYAPHIISGIIVTGDVFVASSEANKRLRRQMNAEVTEMEGAAVAQTCWQQHVPFLIIRSLSDNANNHASLDVKTFYQVAAHNSAALVMEVVRMLGKN